MSKVTRATQSFGFKIGEQRIGPIFGLIGKPAGGRSAEFHQDHHGDGGVGWAEIRDGLRQAVFENAEIFFFQAWDEVAVLGGGNNVQSHDGDFNGDGDTRFLRGLLLGRRLFLLRRGIGLRWRAGLWTLRRLRPSDGTEQKCRSGRSYESTKRLKKNPLSSLSPQILSPLDAPGGPRAVHQKSAPQEYREGNDSG